MVQLLSYSSIQSILQYLLETYRGFRVAKDLDSFFFEVPSSLKELQNTVDETDLSFTNATSLKLNVHIL